MVVGCMIACRKKNNTKRPYGTELAD
ncbi:MAG: hypothetical protein JWN13_3469, partial [Betaproteobacteria bacterium]|nr:hypothetical protein [Betaproteobacteria bacterium]